MIPLEKYLFFIFIYFIYIIIYIYIIYILIFNLVCRGKNRFGKPLLVEAIFDFFFNNAYNKLQHHMILLVIQHNIILYYSVFV